jgi:predicted ATP-dependent serine protease
MADALTAQGHKVIYNNSEMIESEIKMMCKRLGLENGFGLKASDSDSKHKKVDLLDIVTKKEKLYTADQALMMHMITAAQERNRIREENHIQFAIRESQRELYPNIEPLEKDNGRVILFIDSIQSLAEGGRAEALSIVDRFVDLAQHLGAVVIFIGQVTKAGQFAGSNGMPHMVTAHLHMSVVSNERADQTREWEAKKNRAGPCDYMWTQLMNHGHQWLNKELYQED